MPRENYRTTNYVASSELETEMQLAMDKIGITDEDETPNRHQAHEPAVTSDGDDGSRLAEAEAEAEKPFIPYCKRSMSAHSSWPWHAQRRAMREYFSEFFGTFLLIIFGNGVVATKFFITESYNIQRDAAGEVVSYTYTSSEKYQGNASYLCVVFGWGMGLAMALYVSGAISGGHVNPAVTLCNAIFGNLPWAKVPFYVMAQFLGAMTGAACVYALFKPHFDQRRDIIRFDVAHGLATPTETDAMGGIFCTYPAASYYGNMYCFWSELCNTMVMMMVICGIGDYEGVPMKKNEAARRLVSMRMKLFKQKKGSGGSARRVAGNDFDIDEADFDLIEDVLVSDRNAGGTYFMSSKPLAVGLLIFELGIATGWNSGYAMNPARDLGPRMVSAMIFRSTDPFTKASHYFLIPMFVPIFGAVLGQFIYTFFICPEEVRMPDTLGEYEEKRLYLATSSHGSRGNSRQRN